LVNFEIKKYTYDRWFPIRKVFIFLVDKMNLPIDMTEDEIKTILKSIWREYAPYEQSDFIDKLSLRQTKQLLDLIMTKDSKVQQRKWKDIDKSIMEYGWSIRMLLQKAKMIMINRKEKDDQEGNDQSLRDIEQNFFK